jgi:hypothetical protein
MEECHSGSKLNHAGLSCKTVGPARGFKKIVALEPRRQVYCK